MRLFFVILIFGFYSLANPVSTDYKLLQVSGFLTANQDDLTSLIHTQFTDEYDFACENEQRYQLFGQDEHFDQVDSLRMLGEDGRKYIYRDGELYKEKNGKRLKRTTDKYIKKVLAAIQTLSKTKVGLKLIQKLQRSPNIFYIVSGGHKIIEKDGVSYKSYTGFNHVDGRDLTVDESKRMEMSYRVKNQYHNFQAISFADDKLKGTPRMIINQIGGNGSIVYNPNTSYEYIDENYRKQKGLTAITLGHEMYHAYDATRGLLDTRRVVYQKSIKGQPSEHASEYRAVRFANTLRDELGKPYKRFYSDMSEHSHNTQKNFKSMLDNNNEPVVIPTPCINWL